MGVVGGRGSRVKGKDQVETWRSLWKISQHFALESLDTNIFKTGPWITVLNTNLMCFLRLNFLFLYKGASCLLAHYALDDFAGLPKLTLV